MGNLEKPDEPYLSAEEAGVQVEHWLKDAYLRGWNDASDSDTGRLQEALSDIIIRCEQGDKRTNWLPIIAQIAHGALQSIGVEAEPGREEEWDPRRTEQRG